MTPDEELVWLRDIYRDLRPLAGRQMDEIVSLRTALSAANTRITELKARETHHADQLWAECEGLHAVLASANVRIAELEALAQTRLRHLENAVGKVAEGSARIAELEIALETAVNVSGEIYVAWDEAPSSMKPGKLVVAMTDPLLHYRADITAMHMVRTKVRQLLAEDN